jgi:hypothetical protein
MRGTRTTEALRSLMMASLFAPAIAWIAYFYEKSTGMTWLSTHQYNSRASTLEHLAATFRTATGSTAIGIAAALALFLILSIRRRSGR